MAAYKIVTMQPRPWQSDTAWISEISPTSLWLWDYIYVYVPGWNDARTFTKRLYLRVRASIYHEFTLCIFNNCAHAHVCIEHSLGVLHDQLRILSVRKCANFHENRLIYAYLSTRVYIDKVASPWQATRNSYTRSFSAIPASLPLILEEQIVSTAHYFSDRILFSKGMCTLISEPISDIPLYHWAQAIFL